MGTWECGIFCFFEIWIFGNLDFLREWDFVLWGRREKVSHDTVACVWKGQGKGVTGYGFQGLEGVQERMSHVMVCTLVP